MAGDAEVVFAADEAEVGELETALEAPRRWVTA